MWIKSGIITAIQIQVILIYAIRNNVYYVVLFGAFIGKLCRMPGCNKPCYSEKGKIYDFCGWTHATEYKDMSEEFQRQLVRDSRLKAVASGSSRGAAAGAFCQ